MRLLPEYRGVRVRPYMRRMNMIIFVLLFCLPLPFLGVYVFFNREAIQNLDFFVIGVIGICLLCDLIVSLYLKWFLQEATPFFKKLERLGRMSRYLFEHGYVYENRTKGQNARTKYKFPKVYMKQRKFDLDVSFEMAGNKFQERFKKIGGELENTLFMDYMETLDSHRYKTYTLAYSAFLNRISVSQVRVEQGKGLRLMKNLYWDFDSDPHMLVAGGTGGGKTVLLRSIIRGISKVGVVDICDPKRADFVTMSDIDAFKGRIVFEIEDIVKQFEKSCVIMMARYDYMRKRQKELGHKDLKKYYDYGLEPYFLVCDEYNALMSMLDFKQRSRADAAIGNLLLLGRQAGCFGIIAMQKPSREDLGSKLQANINFRVSVGRLDEGGYNTLFGDVNQNKEFKYLKYLSGIRIYGRGYSAVYGEVAREFYSPLLEKGFSFFDAYERIERHENRFSPDENAEIKPEIVDDKELMNVVHEVAQQIDLPRPKEEQDDFFEGDVEETFTVLEVAEEIGTSARSVRDVIKILESEGYCDFERKDGKYIVVSFENKEILVSLFNKKEDFTGTWSNLIEAYFSN